MSILFCTSSIMLLILPVWKVLSCTWNRFTLIHHPQKDFYMSPFRKYMFLVRCPKLNWLRAQWCTPRHISTPFISLYPWEPPVRLVLHQEDLFQDCRHTFQRLVIVILNLLQINSVIRLLNMSIGMIIVCHSWICSTCINDKTI